MIFSDLAVEFTGETNPLYVLRDQIISGGSTVTDLVSGNVTEHGLGFPQDLLKEILTQSVDSCAAYHPDPSGRLAAREAIRAYYGACNLSAKNILLTPGTSISYWYCFKLLAESGDEILTPTPSYPLLDYIAKLCGVDLVNYRLDESREWAIDLEHLSRQITQRTRAIVLISPHNPTGMVCSPDDVNALAEVAVRYNLPIISDEVFGDFLFELDSLPRPANTAAPLVFTLNGFSKSFALPGLKLGWIAVTGREDLVMQSVAVLEMISDTFLPVSEIVQASVPEIFKRGKEFRSNYIEAVSRLRKIALDSLSGARFAPPRGGFYITIPVRQDEDEVALSLLSKHKILVHPGHFYEINGNHVVSTIIQEPETLGKCLLQIKEYVG